MSNIAISNAKRILSMDHSQQIDRAVERARAEAVEARFVAGEITPYDALRACKVQQWLDDVGDYLIPDSDSDLIVLLAALQTATAFEGKRGCEKNYHHMCAEVGKLIVSQAGKTAVELYHRGVLESEE